MPTLFRRRAEARDARDARDPGDARDRTWSLRRFVRSRDDAADAVASAATDGLGEAGGGTVEMRPYFIAGQSAGEGGDDDKERQDVVHPALHLLERMPRYAAGWLEVRVGERRRFGSGGLRASGGLRSSGGMVSRKGSLGGVGGEVEGWSVCWAEVRAGYVLVSRWKKESLGRAWSGRGWGSSQGRSSTGADDSGSAGGGGGGGGGGGSGATGAQYVFGITNCLVHVKEARRGPGVVLRIVPSRGAELVLRFASKEEVQPWLWALSSTVSPYQSVSLDTFEVQSPLGAGAFGKVYLVRDTRSGENLALKVLDKKMVFHDSLHFESAVNERLALELTCGLDFVTSLRYATQTNRYFYLVTDFCEGGDLFNFLRNYHTHLREAHAVRIIAQVVLALESMHDLRLVYRDLKPENVLIDHTGNVRLADLGLAKLLRPETAYLTTTVCGSMAYAAPCMLAGEAYGIAFDQWCLGVFIYQVLTGDLPFQTDDMALDAILDAQMRGDFPQGILSDDAYSIVRNLLSPAATNRPSCAHLKTHPFFADIHWPDLADKVDHKFSLSRVMEVTNADFRAAQLATRRRDDSGVPVATDQLTHAEAEDEELAFTLRNFNFDDFSDMSISDVSDGVSTSSLFHERFTRFPAQAEETRALPGWSFSNRSGTHRPPAPPKSLPRNSPNFLRSGSVPDMRKSKRFSMKSV